LVCLCAAANSEAVSSLAHPECAVKEREELRIRSKMAREKPFKGASTGRHFLVEVIYYACGF
jgi:hypothetical protein